MTPTKRPHLAEETVWRERLEQAATIVSFLMRETQAGDLRWSYLEGPPFDPSFSTSVDGKDLILAGGELVTLHTLSDGKSAQLLPLRATMSLQAELRDLLGAVRFQSDSPPPAFDDLFQIANAKQSK